MEAARHLLIYGPPGAGKLTVARELEARYGVHVLDNHVAVDAALRLFTFGQPGFARLCEEIRVTMLRAAAAANLDVVSTFAYGHGVDDDAIQALIDASTTHGANVTVAQLLPSDDELRRRVVAESRHASNKITDLSLYDEVRREYDLRTPFAATDVTIDNTATTAAAVAEHLALLAGLTPV